MLYKFLSVFRVCMVFAAQLLTLWTSAGWSAVPCPALPPKAHLHSLTHLGQSQQNLPSSWDPDQELQVLQAEHKGSGL